MDTYDWSGLRSASLALTRRAGHPRIWHLRVAVKEATATQHIHQHLAEAFTPCASAGVC